MKEIKNYLKDKETLKKMLLTDLEYNKTGGLTQISLDTNCSIDFIYSNYFEILNICK